MLTTSTPGIQACGYSPPRSDGRLQPFEVVGHSAHQTDTFFRQRKFLKTLVGRRSLYEYDSIVNENTQAPEDGISRANTTCNPLIDRYRTSARIKSDAIGARGGLQ